VRFAGRELFANQREAEDATFKAVREARKERSFLLILEEVELTDDVVTLLAGLDEFAQAWMVAAKAAAGTCDLWIHAGHEESVVADVLTHGALGIKGRRAAEDRVGGVHHCSQLFDGAALLIAHLVEIVGLGELAEQVGNIAGYVRIVQPKLALITVADRLLEEGFERMSLHTHLL
jgi:hypothetical protein